jgi:outer membrane immunogenic protein
MTRQMLAGSLIGVVAMFGQTAFAADMMTKAPQLPRYDWTGLHFGGHVGGGWLSNPNSMQASNFPVFTADQSFQPAASGALGGVQLGYDWQLASPWVVGVEGDFTWTGIKGSETVQVPSIGTVFGTMGRDVHWLATLRGRLGYSVDRWLVYATGGLAYGRIGYDAVTTTPGPVWTGTHTATKTGWSVGGGVEYGLPGTAWLLRAEYLYYDFGSETFQTGLTWGGGIETYRYDWDRTRIHTMRIGLSYKFGADAVAAKY